MMDEEEAGSLRQDVRIHPILIPLSSVPSSPSHPPFNRPLSRLSDGTDAPRQLLGGRASPERKAAPEISDDTQGKEREQRERMKGHL